MDSLLRILSSGLEPRALDTLGAQVGAEPRQTERAVQAALPLLLGALQRNASAPAGAEALLGALRRDHDGSALDDAAAFFGTPASSSDLRSLDHIFGRRRAPVENAVARASGLGSSQVVQLLAQLAPIVLAALARARGGGARAPRAEASPGGGLGDLLGGALSKMQGSNPGLGGLLGGLLDSDGDGSVADDLLEKALGGGRRDAGGRSGGASGGGLGDLLGGLLGGRQ